MKFLALDVEISKVAIENPFDLRRWRRLGIACAATQAADEESPQLWYSTTSDGHYAPAMAQGDVRDLVGYLQYMVAEGYTILTWDGLAFDMRLLAEESGLHAECAELAVGHVDMMYQVFCLRGHQLNFEKAVEGLNLSGEIEGMSGAKAPQMWAEGQHEKALVHVAQNVRIKLEVASEVQRLGILPWISDSGRQSSVAIDRWLTVIEAHRLRHFAAS